MPTSSENNKRIAKNTILLYIRMLLLMLISLYTSRVILNELGVQDFGIYNVVGGVVSMFSIISSSLSSAISRFITFELGKGDLGRLNKIFSASVTIQIGLSLVIVLIIDTLGLWFLNNKMVIPESRMSAANWVLQFSILAFVINLISVPYNAAIIAHEKMSAFAYISIYEGISKLVIAFLIAISPIDRLVFYSAMTCVAAISVRCVYGYYCKHHFKECSYKFYWDRSLLLQIFSFAGWSFIGNAAGILRTQGVNILLNLYFGPIVNAANGIATQVNNAVSGFSNNFMTAVNPQIIKTYSRGDLHSSYLLVMNSARFSFMLMFAITTPVIVAAPLLLKLWLKTIPDYSIEFVRLILILSLVESICIPLVTLNQATGKIRNYQLVVGCIHLLNFPISWACLKIGLFPSIVYFVAIGLAIINLYARLYMLRRSLGISINLFNKEVVLRIIVVMFVAYSLIFLERIIIENKISLLLSSLFIGIVTTYALGIKKQERQLVINKMISIIKK
jgi:O-antigen/teichoic acid export membrane protein